MELYLISGALFSSDSSLWRTDTRLAPTKSFSADTETQQMWPERRPLTCDMLEKQRVLTQVQPRDQAQSHQRLVLHDHVLAGCHGHQVLDASSSDDRPDDFLDKGERSSPG